MMVWALQLPNTPSYGLSDIQKRLTGFYFHWNNPFDIKIFCICFLTLNCNTIMFSSIR
jgi:hypothetical protein